MTAGPLRTVNVLHDSGVLVPLCVEPWGPDLAVAPALNRDGGFASSFTVVHVRSGLALADSHTSPWVCLPCARVVVTQLLESDVDWSVPASALNADPCYARIMRRCWAPVDGCQLLHTRPT